MSADRPTVAIAGLGSIGRALVPHLASDERYRLTAVASGRTARARAFLDEHAPDVPLVSLDELPDYADTVVECAPPSVFTQVATPTLESGRTLLTLSAGALLDHWSLVELAQRTHAQVLVPTGALVGLDAVQGLAQGTISSVRLITRKPTASLVDAPFVTQQGIELSGPTQRIFEGPAREAITGFPTNLNVAVALSLAGIGPDRTIVEVWADPNLQHNTHRVVVESDAADLDLSISNVPSDNPATGRSTALSVVALLRKLASPLRIGT